MSKLSHKVRHDLRLSVSDRMELADALDAMESALRKVRRELHAWEADPLAKLALSAADEALAKLGGS